MLKILKIEFTPEQRAEFQRVRREVREEREKALVQIREYVGAFWSIPEADEPFIISGD